MSRGKYLAIVDDADFEWASKIAWFTSGFKSKYVASTIDGKTTYLHRMVMGALRGQAVDHINRNPLDNRRENLRFCSQTQNNANGDMARGHKSSKFRGVAWDAERGKWLATIRAEKRNKYLGRYASEIEAAKAYNECAIRLYGEFATLNQVEPCATE